ncbi:hypothetical protein QNH99_09095 [Pantoea allii]|uniref:hypothetical protein n=1 Tax=Pantoea TaxID=53335 RepID=UPI0011AE0F10|nr:hypothetical protein [Pantoea sp. SJZ147]TWD31607.1 hypothetical protein FBY13_1247 [Pantoea sp. SJZ147]
MLQSVSVSEILLVLEAGLITMHARIDRQSLPGKPIIFTLPLDGLLRVVNTC